jgi:predicted molibdopterin-dependent oxidoreductase YjgC
VHRPWDYGDARQVLREISKAVPAYAEINWDALGESGVQTPAPAGLRSSRHEEVIAVTPTPAPAEGAFWLVSAPLLWDSGTFMEHAAEQVRGLTPAPFVALSPGDFGAAGLTEGSEVTVSSEYGSVRLIVRTDASVQPGTVWVPAGLAGAPAETLGARRGEPVAVVIQHLR